MTTAKLKRYRQAIWAGCLLMVVLYLILVSMLGGSDYDQAVADHEWTCQMISEGVWPPDASENCPPPLDTLALTAR